MPDQPGQSHVRDAAEGMCYCSGMVEDMLLLAVLPVGVEPERLDISGWWRRKAARAVLLDEQGRVALMHVVNAGCYKLPGGGLEGDETAEAALMREVAEETGCAQVIVERPIGLIDEYRAERSFYQRSYCYLARATGEISEPQLTEDELALGFRVEWFPSIQAALDAVMAAQPAAPEGQDIRDREMRILQAALALHGAR